MTRTIAAQLAFAFLLASRLSAGVRVPEALDGEGVGVSAFLDRAKPNSLVQSAKNLSKLDIRCNALVPGSSEVETSFRKWRNCECPEGTMMTGQSAKCWTKRNRMKFRALDRVARWNCRCGERWDYVVANNQKGELYRCTGSPRQGFFWKPPRKCPRVGKRLGKIVGAVGLPDKIHHLVIEEPITRGGGGYDIQMCKRGLFSSRCGLVAECPENGFCKGMAGVDKILKTPSSVNIAPAPLGDFLIIDTGRDSNFVQRCPANLLSPCYAAIEIDVVPTFASFGRDGRYHVIAENDAKVCDPGSKWEDCDKLSFVDKTVKTFSKSALGAHEAWIPDIQNHKIKICVPANNQIFCGNYEKQVQDARVTSLPDGGVLLQSINQLMKCNADMANVNGGQPTCDTIFEFPFTPDVVGLAPYTFW